jgi:hypothetical protein
VDTADNLTICLRPQQFLRVDASPELTGEIQKIGSDWQVELLVGEQ